MNYIINIKEVEIVIMEKYKKLHTKNENIVSFFRNSPLLGVEIDIERDKTPMRDIEFD